MSIEPDPRSSTTPLSSLPGGDTPGQLPAEEYILATAVPEKPLADERSSSGRRVLPLVLFLLTCYTTFRVGSLDGSVDGSASMANGLMYSGALMTILLCHEFGHYLQARRYRVPASLPYFIPIPFPPLGTMGAVIGMQGNMKNRKCLFDIGITGPLAGLGPALVCSVLGLYWSRLDTPPAQPDMAFGIPVLYHWLIQLIFGALPEGQVIYLHPLAAAGWVGILITAVNLMPIGQLDGGHVLYAILRKRAHVAASGLLALAIAAVVLTGTYQWSLMLFLLVLIGPNHPPTADDSAPLGTGRIILGWLTLAFVLIGFTPRPFIM